MLKESKVLNKLFLNLKTVQVVKLTKKRVKLFFVKGSDPTFTYKAKSNLKVKIKTHE